MLVAVLAGGGLLSMIGERVRARVRDRGIAVRSRQAEAVAREAALDEEVFDPERIRRGVGEILDVARRLGGGDVDAAEGRSDQERIEAWSRFHRITSGDSISAVRVELVRVLNRGDSSNPTVDVRLRATLRGPADGRLRRGARIDERWSLRPVSERWVLSAYGPLVLVDPVVDAVQVASPAVDDERLRAAGVKEIAAADAVVEDLSELIDLSLAPEDQLAELAAVDARFGPDVIEAVLRELIDAWADPARTGERQNRLLDRSTAQGFRDLLRPPTNYDGALMIIRDASLKDWRPVGVSQSGDRPTVDVELTVLARRYLSYGKGSPAGMPGSKTRRRPIAMRWSLALDTDSVLVWRLTHSSNPATDIPGAMP